MVPKDKKLLLVKLLNAKAKGFHPDFVKRLLGKLLAEYPDLEVLARPSQIGPRGRGRRGADQRGMRAKGLSMRSEIR